MNEVILLNLACWFILAVVLGLLAYKLIGVIILDRNTYQIHKRYFRDCEKIKFSDLLANISFLLIKGERFKLTENKKAFIADKICISSTTIFIKGKSYLMSDMIEYYKYYEWLQKAIEEGMDNPKKLIKE